MIIKALNKRPDLERNNKLNKKYIQFEKLLNELRSRELPTEMVVYINNDIEQINSILGTEKELGKQLRIVQSRILKDLEKKLKIVTKNHYRNTWLVLGMATFGIPLGVVFGTTMGNMAFLGIGMPIGMVIGMVVGASMDKKASENGKQLDLEIK